MGNEKPAKKKGFFAILKDSFSKSGGCCGSGETCGGPDNEADKTKPKDSDKPQSKDTSKPAQK